MNRQECFFLGVVLGIVAACLAMTGYWYLDS